MQTKIARKLGIEFPIFAFSHTRDVVVEVSRAGGFGVLGAVGFTPEQLATELDWIDEHIGDRPYGVDIVIPGRYEGMGELDPEKLEKMLADMIPDEHRRFAAKLLSDHGVPEMPDDVPNRELIGWTEATATPQVLEALRHPNVKLIANALGTPPVEIIDEIHESGRLVAALCGSASQAAHHRDAGLDIVIAQGTEGGGHTGEVGSMVLWPEVIDEVAPVPVLAAGGVGSGRQMAAALALGAEGVWTGSLWLTVAEADIPPAQMESYLAATSRDTVRSRAWTGKPCRMLRNDWTDAWADPDNPQPLGMPLQFMVTSDAVRRGHAYPEAARDVNFNPAGQIIGAADRVRPAAQVVMDLVTECVEAQERLAALMAVEA